MNTNQRQRPFQRNRNLEKLIKEINSILHQTENEIISQYHKPKYPVLFVIGAPRSGTTLLMQWLAATGQFAYPTNLLSRFYQAPYIGAKIQLLLTDPLYNYRNELLDFHQSIDFDSECGKTQGVLAPNEFWYFWRRFIPNTEPRVLTKEEEEKIDIVGFLKEIAALEAVFNKPLIMKALIIQYNLTKLTTCFDKVLYLYMKRSPFYNIQSLLEARNNFYGNWNSWYSVKPKEYQILINTDPIHQVTGQVYYTNQSIEHEIDQMNPNHTITIEYEELCHAPHRIYRRIVNKLKNLGYNTLKPYQGLKSFRHTNTIRVSNRIKKNILMAYQEFSGIQLHIE